MDVGFFLSVFGLIAIFSLLFCLVFFKPKFEKTAGKTWVDSNANYPNLYSNISKLLLAILILAHAFYPNSGNAPELSVALVFLLFLGSLA